MSKNVSLGVVTQQGSRAWQHSCLRKCIGPAVGLFLSSTTERRLERALAEGQQRGGQLQEQLTQQLSQALSSAVAGRLERSIRDEIKKTVPPCEFLMRFLLGEPCGYRKLLNFFWLHPSFLGVSRSLEPVAGQLSNSVATKLTAVEGSMKENISKLLKSKVMQGPGWEVRPNWTQAFNLTPPYILELDRCHRPSSCRHITGTNAGCLPGSLPERGTASF